MTKKICLVACALMATLVLVTNGFAQCGSFTGKNVQFVGAGSSAQFNTFAYAAEDHATALGLTPAIWSAKNAKSGSTLYLKDTRFGAFTPTAPSDAVNMWVVYDTTTADCYVWVYFSVDSTVGVKDFYAFNKNTSPVANTGGAVYMTGSGDSIPSVFGAGQSIIPGLTDASAALPSAIVTFLTTAPGPVACSANPNAVGCTGHTTGYSLANPSCGQLIAWSATTAKGNYCFISAGMTDIRPEDALFATTRALSAYSTTNSVNGLGYNQTVCGSLTTNQGCPIYSAMASGTVFNVLRFALSGTDPVTKATIPASSTMSTGADPVVVFVNNADTSALGFGAGAPVGPYTFTDINHKNLAFIYDGTSHCTGDILPTVAGAGEPIQVLQREPLSGTYNTFEFTAVRTMSGSAATAVGQNKVSSITWLTDDESSQELNNNPAQNFGIGGCPGNATTAPTSQCGDPMYQPTTGSACGAGVRMRAIGTGELVKGVLGQNTGQPAVLDSIGYAFWGYQNFNPLATAKGDCTPGPLTGDSTCTSYLGHYLTVDSIDPLFTTPGGQYDASPNPQPFNVPICTGVLQNVVSDFPCYQIPFTHIYDGTYPLWSLLRLVTFENVGTTQETPEGVINLVGYAEQESAPGSSKQLSDFVPFLKGVTGLPYAAGGAYPTGSLNLGVFRSHYKQTNNPDNGHYQDVSGTYSACSTSSISILGATKSTATCWVDAGGDVGGSVFTVQSDLDFIADFGLNAGALNPPNPVEIYGLHQ
jgi:hypothetical protein